MKGYRDRSHNHSKSSKILDYSNMSQSYDSITKININKKKSSSKLSIYDSKKIMKITGIYVYTRNT